MVALLLFTLLLHTTFSSIEDMNQFASWDQLTRLKGQALFIKPGAEQCFGLGLHFAFNYSLLEHVNFHGYTGKNVTEEVYRHFTNFCHRLPSDAHRTSGYAFLPHHLQEFDDVNIGETLRQPHKITETEYDYEEETDFTVTKTFDVHNVFRELEQGRFEQIVPYSMMNEIITDYFASHVEDQIVKNTVVENAFAKIARMIPARCDRRRKTVRVKVCFPMLDFFDNGYIFEVVHKGEFIEVANTTYFAQVSLPPHVYVPRAEGHRPMPVDLTLCEQKGRVDFFCPQNAILKDSVCQPPILHHCEIIISDDRMMPKTRYFSDAYLVRSFKDPIFSLCGNETKVMELQPPINILWRPIEECSYTVGEDSELPGLDGEAFLTVLKNELTISVDADLLRDYFYERLPVDSPEPRISAADESVWRHQRRRLFIDKVDTDTLIVGWGVKEERPKVVLSDVNDVVRQTNAVQTNAEPELHKNEFEWNSLYVVTMIISLCMNTLILVIFVTFICRTSKSQKGVIDNV